MTDIVVDASVALAWCFPDEGSEYAESVLIALEGRRAVVPAVWPLEIANALAVGERRRRIGPPAIRRFIELLNGLTIGESALPVAENVGGVLPLARKYGLSAYDASYLDTALRHGVPLATLDAGLKKAAKKAAVKIFP